MPEIPTKTKTITLREVIPAAYRWGKLIWKVSGGKISIYNHDGALIHHIPLDESEQAHLNRGGKIIVVHACGTEVHIKL